MYGYAPEVLDYLTQLFGGGQQAPQAGAPMELLRARQGSPRQASKAKKPAGLLSAKPADKSVPTPPKRPDMPRGQQLPTMNIGGGRDAFLKSQGIGVPQTAPEPQSPMPQIDRGPQVATPRGPTWDPNQPAPSQTMTHGQLPPIDIGMKGVVAPDLGAQIQRDMAAEAPYASAAMAALTARSPAAMLGRMFLPKPQPQGLLSGPESPLLLTGPTGNWKGAPQSVPEVQPSYWGPNGASMAAKPPSMDDVPMLNPVRNNHEFYDPQSVDAMSAAVRGGDKNAIFNWAAGPIANRPNYGEVPPGVKSPFAGGGKDSVPLWQTYIRSMNRGQ